MDESGLGEKFTLFQETFLLYVVEQEGFYRTYQVEKVLNN
jgi:hypothetical protein